MSRAGVQLKATYRRKVRNGLVTRRLLESPRPERGSWLSSRQSPSFWAFILVGGIIACGFLASLRWQLIAQQTAREEVQLRATLDQIKTENKYLRMEQVGALSPQRLESQLAAGAGLGPMKLDDASAVKTLESQIRAQERQEREAQLRALERERTASVKDIEKKEKVETTNPSGSPAQ
jgi:hypothetical protein